MQYLSMLISDKDEFIFIHIPKTAGSSIRKLLLPRAIKNPTSRLSSALKRFDLPKDYRKFRFGLHYSLLEAQLKLPDEVFESYKKIAFVRNPWDRMVSSFAYKVHGTKDKKRTISYSFEEFIKSQANRKNQSDYLLDKNGDLGCDFIGRFESLDEDYLRMQAFLNIELPPLTKLNVSKRSGAYRDYYTQSTRDLVAQYYKNDIELFGYQF